MALTDIHEKLYCFGSDFINCVLPEDFGCVKGVQDVCHQLEVSSISLSWNDGFSLRNVGILSIVLLGIASDSELSIPRMYTAFTRICKDMQVIVISLSNCIAHSRSELMLFTALTMEILLDHKITTCPDNFFPNTLKAIVIASNSS